jgi:hypothetical protein
MQPFSGPEVARLPAVHPSAARPDRTKDRGPVRDLRFAFRVFSNRLRIGETIQGPQLAGAGRGAARSACGQLEDTGSATSWSASLTQPSESSRFRSRFHALLARARVTA